MKWIREWYARQDVYEQAAIQIFGIGCPLGILVFVLTLFLIN